MSSNMSVYSDIPIDIPSDFTYQLPLYYIYKQFYEGGTESSFSKELVGFSSYLVENNVLINGDQATFDATKSDDFTNPEIREKWIVYLEAKVAAEGNDLLGIDKVTLQSYLRFDYISTGNDAVVSQMNGVMRLLEDITSASDYLSTLVTLFNKRGEKASDITLVDVSSTGEPIVDPTTGQAVTNVNSALVVVSDVTATDFTAMKEAYNALLTIKNRTSLPSLSESLTKVLDGLTSFVEDTSSSAFDTWKSLWAVGKSAEKSGVDSASTGLDLQQSLIVTQNLNEVAKAQLKKALFTFEEFYKSASVMSEAITEMLEALARRITR